MNVKHIAGEAARKVARKLNLVGPSARTKNPKFPMPKGRSRNQFTIKGITYCEERGEASVVSGVAAAGDVKIPQRVRGLAVSVVKDRAFAGNKSITSVTLPMTVRLMGAEVFSGCSSLVSAVLPPRLEVMGARTFSGCDKLKSVRIPGRLRKIGAYAFDGCSGLEVVDHHVVYWSTVCEFVEERLPVTLRDFGKGCFRGCASLKRVDIPYSATTIPKDAFAGCASLAEVSFHSRLEKVEKGAFAGCSALKSVRLPGQLSGIGKGAFESSCELVAELGSCAEAYAKSNGMPFKGISSVECKLDSSMWPGEDGESRGQFYTDEQLVAAEAAYQVRSAVGRAEHKPVSAGCVPARYSFDGTTYHLIGSDSSSGRMNLVFVGDLMCNSRQQAFHEKDGSWDFSRMFSSVTELVGESDLALSNMETVCSVNQPYAFEARYVEDRVMLNAPEQFLAAVRNAGFDVVTNAQNHIYDAGVRGVYETLAALNRNQLMHTGAFAGPEDKRYLLVEANGITVGIVAYLDHVRQKMKRANFTPAGLSALFSTFDQGRVAQDIADARAAGAEFIIACCHWGEEFTDELSVSQQEYAQLVADAGADYIIGSHSHCPQPYVKIKASDGRVVPCVYSCGNFISAMHIHRPITYDTLLGRLVIVRRDDGSVMVEDESYVPYRIIETDCGPGVKKTTRRLGSVIVKPCEELFNSESADERLDAEEAFFRITSVMGEEYRWEGAGPAGKLLKERLNKPSGLQARVVAGAPLAWLGEEARKNASRFFLSDGVMQTREPASVNEVILTCAGQVDCSASLTGSEPLVSNLRFTQGCFEGSDISLVSLTNTRGATERQSSRCEELFDALRKTGVDCVVAASDCSSGPHGDNVQQLVGEIETNGLLACGLGESPLLMFELNDIRFAVISLSAKGWDSEIGSAAIRAAKEQGAEFVLAYLDSLPLSGALDRSGCRGAAVEVAEAGADYVICAGDADVAEYVKHATRDGRVVPIATSLGTYFSTAKGAPALSAMLRLSVRKDERGVVTVKDRFIPLKRFGSYQGVANAVAAASEFFNEKYAPKDFRNVQVDVAKRLGEEILPDDSRRVKLRTHNQPQLTVKELVELCGTVKNEEVLKKLAGMYNKPVERVVFRAQDLTPGCVAVQASSASGYSIPTDEAVKKGAMLIIGNKQPKSVKVPYLAIEKPREASRRIMRAIRDKYDPIVVGITGTVGKSTTKELMYAAFKQHYKTLCIEGNCNTFSTASVVAQKLTPDTQAYVQEISGGNHGVCSGVSKMVRPNICIITAIGEAHLDAMGSIENIVKEKMSITAGMQEGGVLILNDDSEYLHEQHPDCRVIRYSMNNPQCDYHAEDIVEQGNQIRFTICCSEGKYKALLSIPGLHNVGNALAVFAAGREAGVPPYEIISGVARFSFSDSKLPSNRVRQNMVDYRGYRFFIDTYNASPSSLASAARTFGGIEIPEGGRRIALVADMLEQGEEHQQIHFDSGVMLAESCVDCTFAYGDDAKYLVEGIRSKGGEAYYFADRDTYNRTIAAAVRPGDAILVKGSHAMHLYEETVVPVFGDVVG